MKTLFPYFLISLYLIPYTSSAQDLTSKKGEPILPEEKDWAISFDAVPFLNYVGNLFSGNTSVNTSPGANWVDPATMTITGKKFITAKNAYRGTVRLGLLSTKVSALVEDAATTTPPVFPAPIPTREDVHKSHRPTLVWAQAKNGEEEKPACRVFMALRQCSG